MEKKEVRLKCTGCGTAFKLKVPITDKPLTFTCKKCGKVMKIRLQAPAKKVAAPIPAAPSPPSPEPAPLIERGQQAETEEFEDLVSMGLSSPPTLPSPAAADVASPATGDSLTPESDKRWLVMLDDMMRGPFSDAEVIAMIDEGDITPSTSIRLGERPWIQALRVPQFAARFRAVGDGRAKEGAEPEDEAAWIATAGLRNVLPLVLPYPLGSGKYQPLAIFAGLAFALSALLCLDFTIGLLVNIVGWMLLYGYLDGLLRETMTSPGNPPPAWDFRQAAQLLPRGARVFVVLLVYSLLPVTIMLLVMIFGFLNGMALVGYVFMLLTVAVYAASLFVAPAALTTLTTSGNLGRALSPGVVIGLIKKGGKAYRDLALLSVAAGMLCMVATLLAVFLIDIPIAGFLVAALLMGGVFSYGHFLWFHLVGRFSAAHKGLTAPAASPA
ncbi:MAG: DUF4013 domain-containing protein [Desulfomonile sp.]|nr:DUF4013 domain-containing protein [Desulfomonile sp.]